MKKVFKNRIFIVIICGIIFASLGVYGATIYPYKANEISYAPSNGSENIKDVNAALNDLYNKLNNSKNNNVDINNITLINGYSIKFVTKVSNTTLNFYTYLYKNEEQIGYYEALKTGVYSYSGSNNAISVTEEDRNIKLTIGYSSVSGGYAFTISFWIDDILMYQYQNIGSEYTNRNAEYEIKDVLYYNNKIYLENLYKLENNGNNDNNITLVNGYSIKFVTKVSSTTLNVYTYLYKNEEQIGYYEKLNTGVYSYNGSENAISIRDNNKNIKVGINYSCGSGYGNFTISFWIDGILMYNYENKGIEYTSRNTEYEIEDVLYYNNKIYLENLND